DNRKLNTVDDLKQAAIDLHKLGASYVLVKGGELEGPAIDVLYEGETLTTYEAPRMLTENTSGAGCTYSAAIAANLAKKLPVIEAVYQSKSYIKTAMKKGFSYTDIRG